MNIYCEQYFRDMLTFLNWHIMLFFADIGVYGMVDPDIFQGRDETIRQEMKANLRFILLLNICTVIYPAIDCGP
jgi:hypothetical protein